jgi:O-antigen/teichoic acid export membrane protein
VTRTDVRGLAGVSAGMLGVGAADVVITALDRVVLAAFRSPATLGLYEGAIRPNNVLRSVAGAFSVTLLPVLSRLKTTKDPVLERDLVLRGTRYMLAGLVPPTAGLMALSEPLLETWLGVRYGEAWVACVIFLAWWALASNAAIAQTTMFVDGHVRRLAKLSWTIAAVNLTLSLALTPWLGLEGVALGTTLAYVALLPAWVRYVIERFGLSLRELARTAWVPAYGTGLLVAGLALAGRAVFPLDDAATVIAVLIASVAIGWAFIFSVVLTPEERRLAREVAGAPAPIPPPGP